MDYVTRRHSDYRELVQSGVMCGQLNSLQGRPGRWQLECQITMDLTRDEAKRLVEMYCRAQWQASDFSYFTKPGIAGHKFFVRFISWAL